MLYNVAQLLKEGIGASRRYALEGALNHIDENNPGSVALKGSVHFLRTPRGILVTGTAHLRLAQTCRRCLEPTEAEVTFDLEEEFIPSLDVVTGASLPITDDDERALVINEQHILDLTEVLRQYTVTENVGLGLCREDCLGLCPVCGKNLNIESCGCNTKEIDPRLASLASLLAPENETK